MKVLWVTNVELPDIANYHNRNTYTGGWLTYSSKLLSKFVDLYIFSKAKEAYSNIKINEITYYSFIQDSNNNNYEEIINRINPDIVHIWGTENKHTLDILKVLNKCNLINRTVVSIQGLVSFYINYYYANIPNYLINKKTFIEYIGGMNIKEKREYMMKMGEYEKESLTISKNCIGRTDWDYNCVKQINKEINYYHCNETLRESFYTKKWNIEECNKYTIFFSQSGIPIKGFHMMLEALKIIKNKYPNVKVNVIGDNPTKISPLKITSYKKYIKKIIISNDFQNNINWLGHLDEIKMAEQYCRNNVFVCASSIENSSNSVSEAMLIGIPVVASNVGGTSSLLEHEKEGLLYQFNEPNTLASNVIKLFDDKELAIKLSSNARKRALIDHDPTKNNNELLDIYNRIVSTH